MIDLTEYFTEKVLDECNIDELKIIVRSMLQKIEYDQQLIHDQLIDKRWYRKIIRLFQAQAVHKPSKRAQPLMRLLLSPVQ